MRRPVREAASASAPHDPAQLPPRPTRRRGSTPPCARLPPKARALVASMPSSAPSCSKEMFVYSLEAASMLCSITARSSTCGARGCRLGVQAGIAGWGCRLGARGCRPGHAGGAHRGAVVERGHLVGREGGREGRHLLLAQGSRHAAGESVRSEGIPTYTTPRATPTTPCTYDELRPLPSLSCPPCPVLATRALATGTGGGPCAAAAP